ncbi:MAG: hypothetical protein JRG96_01240 [Deltaproteobacteria bacterium]|nr:hypothetical protein [Deltaproteobacteria bacterium]MBW2420323.1 hypothetical protein [Deltaproteobacteria bacterium]
MERLRQAAIACVALIGLLAMWYGIEEASLHGGAQRANAAPDTRRASLSAPASARTTTAAPAPASAAAPISGSTCNPSRLPIQMIVVRNAQEVKSSAGNWPDDPTLVREAETVIFSDGLIVTSNVEGTSDHLNDLGWASRRIQFLAAAGLKSKSKRLRRRG